LNRVTESLWEQKKVDEPSAAKDTGANAELLSWVNSHLPSNTKPASDLHDSLRSGEILVRLLEKCSGKESSITSAEFATFAAPSETKSFDPSYFDVVFNVFDYMSPIISSAFSVFLSL
jgi:hypothetical protein